eukprot:3595274-Pyramimonas_sp.AAC.1
MATVVIIRPMKRQQLMMINVTVTIARLTIIGMMYTNAHTHDKNIKNTNDDTTKNNNIGIAIGTCDNNENTHMKRWKILTI